jgi:hypothetical protein
VERRGVDNRSVIRIAIADAAVPTVRRKRDPVGALAHRHVSQEPARSRVIDIRQAVGQAGYPQMAAVERELEAVSWSIGFERAIEERRVGQFHLEDDLGLRHSDHLLDTETLLPHP